MPHPSSDEEQKVTVVAAAHGVSFVCLQILSVSVFEWAVLPILQQHCPFNNFHHSSLAPIRLASFLNMCVTLAISFDFVCFLLYDYFTMLVSPGERAPQPRYCLSWIAAQSHPTPPPSWASERVDPWRALVCDGGTHVRAICYSCIRLNFARQSSFRKWQKKQWSVDALLKLRMNGSLRCNNACDLLSPNRYVDSSVLQRILRDHHGDVLAYELLQDAGVFGSSGSSSSLSSMKASQARLQVCVWG